MILKWILNNTGRCWLDSYGAWWGSCAYGNEIWGSINGGEFRDYFKMLSGQLLNNGLWFVDGLGKT